MSIDRPRPRRRLKLHVLISVVLFHFARVTVAVPIIALPINSQVPPVARAGKPYHFIFAESTFARNCSILNYTIDHGPAWLHLDSTSRTLFGTPDPAKLGPFKFDLTASDDSGASSDSVTFIVSDTPGPALGKPIAQQLASFGRTSDQTSLLLHPGDPFSVAFGFDTFTNTSPSTNYYALCANNTPLPSWIKFNPADLSFAGTATQSDSPNELQQSVDIRLTASDVAGFSGAIASFHIIVELHEFTFGSQELLIKATSQQPISYNGLQTALTLDGKPVKPTDLKNVSLVGPEWLSVDLSTLQISGIPPKDIKTQTVPIIAEDLYGDVANSTLLLSTGPSSSVLIGDMPALHATIGAQFSYAFSRNTLAMQNSTITMDLGNASSWLQFDPDSLTLSGFIPADLHPQMYTLGLTATLGQSTDSTEAHLYVQSQGGPSAAPSSTALPAPTSTTSTNNPTVSAASGTGNGSVGSDATKVVAAVVLPIVGLVALLLLCIWLHRKKRKKSNGGKEKKSLMSRFRSGNTRDEEAHDSEGVFQQLRPSSRHWSLPRINPQAGMFSIPLPRNRQSMLHSPEAMEKTAARASRTNPIEESEWETILPEPKEKAPKTPNSRKSRDQPGSSRVTIHGPQSLIKSAKNGNQSRRSMRQLIGHPNGPPPMYGLGHGRGNWGCGPLYGPLESQHAPEYGAQNDSGIGKEFIGTNGRYQLEWPNATAVRNPRHFQQRSEGWSTLESGLSSSGSSGSICHGSCFQHSQFAAPEFRSPPITGRKTYLVGNTSSGIESSANSEPSFDPRSHAACQDAQPGEHLLNTLNVPPKIPPRSSQRLSSWTYDLEPEDRRIAVGFSTAPRGSLSAQRKGQMIQQGMTPIANHTYRVINRFQSANTLASNSLFEDTEEVDHGSTNNGDIWEDELPDEHGQKVWRKADEASSSSPAAANGSRLSTQRLGHLMGQYRERHGNDLTIGKAGKRTVSVENKVDVAKGLTGNKSFKGTMAFP